MSELQLRPPKNPLFPQTVKPVRPLKRYVVAKAATYKGLRIAASADLVCGADAGGEGAGAGAGDVDEFFVGG
jgi:hypothetical protein